jgi:hypothetical protein
LKTLLVGGWQVLSWLWYVARDAAVGRAQAAQQHPAGEEEVEVQEDADVAAERSRIQHTPIDFLMHTDALILHGQFSRNMSFFQFLS